MKTGFKVPKSKYSFLPKEKPAGLWRSPAFWVLLLITVLIVLFRLLAQKEVVAAAEYTQDGMSYRVAIEGRADVRHWQGSGFLAGRSLPQPFVLGREIVVYERPAAGGHWQEKKRYDFAGVGPWCVAMGQMDERKDIEVFIGAYRATRYFPEGPRPYFFTWDMEQQKLLRLWSGSYLDAPVFTAAAFEDMDGDGRQELKLDERQWLGETEYHYITYYTYWRSNFQPVKLKREVIE